MESNEKAVGSNVELAAALVTVQALRDEMESILFDCLAYMLGVDKDKFTVGDLTVKLQEGRRSFKYEEAVREYLAEAGDEDASAIRGTIERHTKMRPTVSWAKVVEALGIQSMVDFEDGPPNFVFVDKSFGRTVGFPKFPVQAVEEWVQEQELLNLVEEAGNVPPLSTRDPYPYAVRAEAAAGAAKAVPVDSGQWGLDLDEDDDLPF